MKAAFLEATGAPDVIRYGELPKPSPKTGEVLVRVGAAALNPIDTYIRAGTVAMPLPKPFIPGCDFAGTVEAVGANLRSMMSWLQKDSAKQGTKAEPAPAKKVVNA